MAGFRIGRGRSTRNAQQHGQHPPQQAPEPYGRPGPGQPTYGSSGQPWHQGGGRPGEPEYLGSPGHGRPAAHDPYADGPGHTQVFSLGEAPDHGRGPYGDGSGHVGGAPAPVPPVGPRLHWKDLLRGIVLHPSATFWQTRDHTVWGPALTVTFLYGLLAVFGFDEAREDVVNSTFSSAVPYVLTTGVAVVLSGLVLGAVTHTLARQFGGDGAWGPTVGLSMLIMSVTDAPRLLLALFLGGDAPLVQVLGWVTWIAAGALFTSMVGRSHDLPWPKALGAASIQLLALLTLIKLGTF